MPTDVCICNCRHRHLHIQMTIIFLVEELDANKKNGMPTKKFRRGHQRSRWHLFDASASFVGMSASFLVGVVESDKKIKMPAKDADASKRCIYFFDVLFGIFLSASHSFCWHLILQPEKVSTSEDGDADADGYRCRRPSASVLPSSFVLTILSKR